MLLDGGIGAPPKVLEAYMGEAMWPAKPIQCQTKRPPQGLVQRGGVILKYASGCCSVAPAT